MDAQNRGDEFVGERCLEKTRALISDGAVRPCSGWRLRGKD